jgi:multidrug resistance efflux pump
MPTTLSRATELLQKAAGSQATLDSATAAAATARAAVDQATANLSYEREQLVVIDANETAAKAQVASAEANLLSSKFALDDTEIWSPVDGVIANRKARVGEYVTAGTRMLSVVPSSNLWIEANYRETQLGQMKVGDPVRVNIDTYPGTSVCGYVEAIAPASGSEFALIPPDNATGNFTKIVRGSPSASASMRGSPMRLSPALACPSRPLSPYRAEAIPPQPKVPPESAAPSTPQRTCWSARSRSCHRTPVWVVPGRKGLLA